jgi:hypothetical protein
MRHELAPRLVDRHRRFFLGAPRIPSQSESRVQRHCFLDYFTRELIGHAFIRSAG